MAKLREKKALGILSRQKPKRRKSVVGRWPRVLIFCLTAAMLLLTGIYAARFIAKSGKVWTLFSSTADLVQVQIKPTEGFELTSADESHIRDVIKATIRETGDIHLNQIARRLHKGTDFERIHIFRPESNKLVVSLKKRSPVLAVMADRLRFLTRDGVVYGESQDNKPILHRLNGVFTSRNTDTFTLDSDNRLVTTEIERQILTEAVELNEAVKASSVAIDFIDFQEYRGFILHLAADQVEVTIGRTPFGIRLKRLESTMAHLKKSGILFSRIELDYEGKAFIKEKKL